MVGESGLSHKLYLLALQDLKQEGKLPEPLSSSGHSSGHSLKFDSFDKLERLRIRGSVSNIGRKEIILAFLTLDNRQDQVRG